MKRLFACLLALLFILIPLASCGENSPDLEVLFLSVGKADAILIKTKNTNVLIDTGYEETYQTVRTALTREGVMSIDHLIITHFDKDHVGGAEKIMNSCPVKNLYLPNYKGTGGEYLNFAEYLPKWDGTTHTVIEQTALVLDEFTMQISPTSLFSQSDDDNNNSLILSLKGADFSLLMMGDAETPRIAEYAAQDTGAYQVVKLPHHGDYTKELSNYLSVIKPQYAVHSCEAGMVDERLTARCTELGIQTFSTYDGDVSLHYHASNNALTIQNVK